LKIVTSPAKPGFFFLPASCIAREASRTLSSKPVVLQGAILSHRKLAHCEKALRYAHKMKSGKALPLQPPTGVTLFQRAKKCAAL
jgi:hypothetical protein